MPQSTRVQEVWSRLQEALPPSEAMAVLRPSSFRTEAAIIAEHAFELAAYPEILAGLWLYVDDLEKAHTVAQSLTNPTGSWWHAIVHRREGDYSNSKYWYRGARGHEALNDLEGFNPNSFVDQTENAANTDADLIATQRREWQALFDWCLIEADLK